jgi:hypothetical protein
MTAHDRGNAQAVVVLAKLPQLRECRVRLRGECGQVIEQVSQVTGEGVVRPGHSTPAVPRQHLDAAQSRRVADQVRGDPPAPGLADQAEPERGRVGSTGPVPLPRLPASEEPASGQVGDVELDPEPAALTVVDLCVGEDPAVLPGVPVLTDPVVLVPPGGEVTAEPAARPGRGSLGAQDVSEQDGEVPAVHWQPARRLTGDVQRPGIAGNDLRQHVLDRTDVHAGPVGLVQRYPVATSHVLVYQQPLGDGGQAGKPARWLRSRGVLGGLVGGVRG